MTSSAPQILMIDDEPQIRKFLEIALRAQGYKTLLAETAQQGLETLVLQGADLVILDLGLPDLDGAELLQQLREWSQVPVIVLSVRNSEQEKIKLLDMGANDYVTKPFSVQELMARIRVMLRSTSRTATPEMAVYDDGQLITQPHLLEVLWGPSHQQDTHYLRILVAKLRAKLQDDAIHPRYIMTEPGVGLRFLRQDETP